MRKLKQLLLLIFALLFIASCRTSKETNKTFSSLSSPEKYTKTVMKKQWPSKALTAKIKLQLVKDNKDISFRGNLKMKKDEVIQLSLSFIGLEVARLEFTPSSVLIIDRYHRRYFHKEYKEIAFLKEAGIDFNTLQALFWHEIFVPGEENILKMIKRFTTSQSGNYTLLLLKDTNVLDFSFLTITDKALLERSLIKTKSGKDPQKLTWRYTDFNQKNLFPQRMEINLQGNSPIFKATIELSKLDNNHDWETHTAINSKYQKINLDDIFKLFN